ncbi:hypothetical protein AAVH_11203 [Aphelenchoides avenae]|nr:hypothetical protein AAVH_11203 [Aphelenchus avenae]
MLALLVAYAPEIKENVQLLMAEVDTDVRLALTLLGVCVQSKNLSESELYESSKKVIQALSKVNDAFQRALQDDTPSSTLAPPQNDTSSGTVTSPLTLAPSTPYGEDVVAFMNQTARNILGKEVKDKLDSQDGLDLPYNRDDQQCRRFPEGKFVDVGYTNLNFFVLYASNDTKQTADEAWERLKDNVKARDAVLNRVFARSSDGLCGRLDTALKDINTTAFHGFAAVKCGYEFVWYELGYAYFFAAHSSTGYKWEKKGSAYDAKCGQIFFFP